MSAVAGIRPGGGFHRDELAGSHGRDADLGFPGVGVEDDAPAPVTGARFEMNQRTFGYPRRRGLGRLEHCPLTRPESIVGGQVDAI